MISKHNFDQKTFNKETLDCYKYTAVKIKIDFDTIGNAVKIAEKIVFDFVEI